MVEESVKKIEDIQFEIEDITNTINFLENLLVELEAKMMSVENKIQDLRSNYEIRKRMIEEEHDFIKKNLKHLEKLFAMVEETGGNVVTKEEFESLKRAIQDIKISELIPLRELKQNRKGIGDDN